MKAGRFNGGRISARRSQRGVILLIALIMLVAMTLAGIGMMRSVDTGSVIAGNLAFKQATLSATDVGTNAAFATLISVANTQNPGSSLHPADKAILNFIFGQPCPQFAGAPPDAATGVAGCVNGAGTVKVLGYAPTPIKICEVDHSCAAPTDYTWWTVNANWAVAPNLIVTDPVSGNTIATVQYLIHRMCMLANAAPTVVPTGGQLCQSVILPLPAGAAPGTPNPSLFYYRITTRSVGTRGTVSYAQSLVLLG